jgi:hypothetical protein
LTSDAGRTGSPAPRAIGYLGADPVRLGLGVIGQAPLVLPKPFPS